MNEQQEVTITEETFVPSLRERCLQYAISCKHDFGMQPETAIEWAEIFYKYIMQDETPTPTA